MKIFVLGAGVSSLAFCSFLKGEDIKVIEKNSFSGRKLLASGNGRCNFTNLNLSKKDYLSEDSNFVDYGLSNFSNKDLLAYFEDLSIEWTSLPSGRCYPKTMSSKTVRDALFLEAKENAKFIFDTEVLDIDFKNKLLITDDKKFKYDILLIASGGKTLKNSGSDGKILEILKKHTKLTKTNYGITNFESRDKLSKKAKGTKIKALASLYVDNKKIIESNDDVIFQDYGLTGSAILDISNQASYYLSKNKNVRLDIDFYPEYSYNTLLGKLKKSYLKNDNKSLEDSLIGFVNENLISDIIKKSKLDKKDKKNIQIEKITSTLKCLSFRLDDIHDRQNAQVTIGGVACDRICNKTMKSKDLEDVYFIGEVMDVAGACGGFNIQWAFSSAKCASDDIRRLNVKNK